MSRKFKVNVGIYVFASVEIEAQSAAEAESRVLHERYRPDDLQLFGDTFKPDIVFNGEAVEVTR